MNRLATSRLLLFLGWLIPISLSLWAINQSNASYDLAKKALDISGRPFVSLEAAKFTDEKYISATYDHGSLDERLRFKISNRGTSLAQNISLTPVTVSTSQSIVLSQEISTRCVAGTGNITLAPGDSTYIQLTAKMTADPATASSTINRINSGQISIPANIELTYESRDLGKKWTVGSSLVVWVDHVDVSYSASD